MYAGRKAMPRGNKITYNRMVEEQQRMHREKLKSIKKRHKGGIMGKPKSHPHMKKNLKREQMMEERFATIEKENRILLEKMSSIMQKSWLDNDGESLPKPRSLLKTQRKFELQRITRENDFILKRIQQREPTYSIDEWNRDRKVNERYVKNIVEYADGAGMGKNRSKSRRQRGKGSKSTGSLPPLEPQYEAEANERLARSQMAQDPLMRAP